MDRRDFLRLSAAGLVGITAGDAFNDADARRSRGGDSYSIVILGDTHYDALPESIYHTGYSDPDPVRESNHRKEFGRNAEMWSDRCPRLLERASRLVGQDTKMAFQMGDLIQGDTGSVESHTKFLDDAFTLVKKAFPYVPLVTVVGNHDARGRDDDEAYASYCSYMPRKMSEELRRDIRSTTFSFMIGKDAYIVIDFTHPDDELIERLFKETEGARYTFVVIHCPVFPYDSVKYSNWILHGRDGKPEARRRMRELFASRDAIVLCGHVHTTEYADWYGDGGRITQMTMSSVWSKESLGTYKVDFQGKSEYCKTVVDAAREGKKVKPAYLPLIEEYRPGFRTYIKSVSAGSYKLKVSDKAVTVDFYAGDSETVSETFKLR